MVGSHLVLCMQGSGRVLQSSTATGRPLLGSLPRSQYELDLTVHIVLSLRAALRCCLHCEPIPFDRSGLES
jgi:hypothetical protein